MTATPAMDINQWIVICENLSPAENFALFGAVIENRFTSLNLNKPRSLVTDENYQTAENWASKNTRRVLHLYCGQYKKFVALATIEFVRSFAPLISLDLNIVIGASVAYIYWAVGQKLDKWCEKYANRNLEGKGIYSGEIPQGQVDTFFKLTYSPPIVELVDYDESYTVSIKRKQVVVPAETTGIISVPSSADVNAIHFSFKPGAKHSFTFEDTATTEGVSGTVENVYAKKEDGPTVLALKARDLIFKR
jgi:hypothetical protein